MIPRVPTRLRSARRAAIRSAGFLLAVGLVAACGTISRTPPVPAPANFPEIAAILTRQGIQVTSIVSGDAGCDVGDLDKTAIGFDAAGLDQPSPVRVHVYIFRNRATYERLRSSVDECARAFVTDPETFESVETSPFVVAGQGPWGASFKAALRTAITEAAGTGD